MAASSFFSVRWVEGVSVASLASKRPALYYMGFSSQLAEHGSREARIAVEHLPLPWPIIGDMRRGLAPYAVLEAVMQGAGS